MIVTPLHLGHYVTTYQILTTTTGLIGTFAGLTVSNANGPFAGSMALDYATDPGDVDLDVTARS